MSLTIARNFVKYFGECPQTFRGISTSIPENVVKHVSSNILGNVSKRSGECRQTFQGMSSNIPGNVVKHSRECPQTFRGMSVLLEEMKDAGSVEDFILLFLCLE